jgi:dihydroxyacetone kinase-like predicted kinase
LTDWNDIAQKELALTPDRLVVDGVKVLEKAGVVDSGAQGFVYLIEGMYLGQYVRNE